MDKIKARAINAIKATDTITKHDRRRLIDEGVMPIVQVEQMVTRSIRDLRIDDVCSKVCPGKCCTDVNEDPALTEADISLVLLGLSTKDIDDERDITRLRITHGILAEGLDIGGLIDLTDRKRIEFLQSIANGPVDNNCRVLGENGCTLPENLMPPLCKSHFCGHFPEMRGYEAIGYNAKSAMRRFDRLIQSHPTLGNLEPSQVMRDLRIPIQGIRPSIDSSVGATQ